MAPRSIIITGAANGVGAACARRFADAGDHLILADTDEIKGKELVAEIKGNGGEAAYVHANVVNRLHVHNIIAEALDAYGRIDALAHTAALSFSAPFLETSEEDFERVIAFNLRGAFLINQAVSKQFVSQTEEAGNTNEGGVIVNVGSVEAVTAAPDLVAFAASQGGLHQLTRAVALALSPYGARANAVGIGAIKGMDIDLKRMHTTTPLKRAGDPEEVAEVVYFFASPKSSYVTGQCLFVDGGRLSQSVMNEEEK